MIGEMQPGKERDQNESLNRISLSEARLFYTQLERSPLDVELQTKLKEIASGGFLSHVVDEIVRAGDPEIDTVLDFGGGSGANLALLAARVPIRRRISYDVVSPRESIAGIEYLSGTSEKLRIAIPDGSVDLILAVEVIEHLYDPDSMVELWKRFLKPGGLLIITTPNLSSAINRISLLLGWQPADTEVSTTAKFGYPGSGHGVVVGHIRVFTFRALLEFIRYRGLIIERAYTVARELKSGTKGECSRESRGYVRLDRIVSRLSRTLASRTIVVARTALHAKEGSVV